MVAVESGSTGYQPLLHVMHHAAASWSNMTQPLNEDLPLPGLCVKFQRTVTFMFVVVEGFYEGSRVIFRCPEELPSAYGECL